MRSSTVIFSSMQLHHVRKKKVEPEDNDWDGSNEDTNENSRPNIECQHVHDERRLEYKEYENSCSNIESNVKDVKGIDKKLNKILISLSNIRKISCEKKVSCDEINYERSSENPVVNPERNTKFWKKFGEGVFNNDLNKCIMIYKGSNDQEVDYKSIVSDNSEEYKVFKSAELTLVVARTREGVKCEMLKKEMKNNSSVRLVRLIQNQENKNSTICNQKVSKYQNQDKKRCIASGRSDSNLSVKYSGSIVKLIVHMSLFEKMIFEGDGENSTQDNSESQDHKMNKFRDVKGSSEYDDQDNPRKNFNSGRHERLMSVNVGVIAIGVDFLTKPLNGLRFRRFRNLIPVLEMAQNNTKLYQKEVKPKFWHGLAMLSTTFENRNDKNIPKKQTPSEFCIRKVLRFEFICYGGQRNFKIWLNCENPLWVWLVAPRKCGLRFPNFISPREIISLFLKIQGSTWNWYEYTSGGPFGPRSGNRLVKTYLNRSQRHRSNCGVDKTFAGCRTRRARQTAPSGVLRIALVIEFYCEVIALMREMHLFYLVRSLKNSGIRSREKFERVFIRTPK